MWKSFRNDFIASLPKEKLENGYEDEHKKVKDEDEDDEDIDAVLGAVIRVRLHVEDGTGGIVAFSTQVQVLKARTAVWRVGKEGHDARPGRLHLQQEFSWRTLPQLPPLCGGVKWSHNDFITRNTFRITGTLCRETIGKPTESP